LRADGTNCCGANQRAIGWVAALCCALSVVGPGTLSARPGMVTIPAGSFSRETLNAAHTVRVSSFAIAPTEATWSQWQAVRTWAADNGYDIVGGIGRADHPVQNVIWYDAVKWLNALSEMEGRTPCYYADGEHTQVYRTGQLDLGPRQVKWDADGYRLPTEAEWEYAYRAGTTTKYYWGDHGREDRINTRYGVVHYWWNPEITGGPNAVAGKLPNDFGLYDMAGNVEEWCWDWYAAEHDSHKIVDPKGPDTGRFRVMRGGGMVMDRMFGAADRHFTYPWYISMDSGFRVASSDPQAIAPTLSQAPLLPVPAHEQTPFTGPEKELVLRPDDDEGLARRLFGHIDLSTAGLEATRQLFEVEADYAGALAAYRDYFVEKVGSGSLEIERFGGANLAMADRWVAIFREGRRVRWFGPGSDFGSTSMGQGEAQNLAAAWMSTGERQYLDAWAWFVAELARYQKAEWNALTWEEMASRPDEANPEFYWFTRSIGYDAGSGMILPQQIAHMIKHAPEGKQTIIPPRALVHVLLMTVEEATGIGLKDDRSNVPNQLIGNGIALVKQGLALSEFRDAPAWLEVGVRRVLRASGTVMRDGTDLEYSINYNANFVHKVDQLNALFSQVDDRPEWLQTLNLKSERLVSMYSALVMPSGAFPSIGNQSYEDRRPRESLRKWLPRGIPGFASIYHAVHGPDETQESDAEPASAPAFTSVALPYGGYYVQRSGWDDDDLYLFMKSSRPGSGHRHADNNGIQLSAYGRHLLVDCAAPPYGPRFLPEHQKEDNDWFGEDGVGYSGSSFSACTVVVDGSNQRKPAKAKPALGYQTTGGTRWLASERLDFMEGRFEDGYISEPGLTDAQMEQLISGFGHERLAYMVERNETLRRAGVREVDAVHDRQVLFVKDFEFWIVTDRVDGGERRSQIWNYPPPHEGENSPNFICPGFSPGQVRADEVSKSISTIDPRGANVHLHHFMDGPVEYEMKFGEKYPHRGWFSFGIGGEKVPAVEMHASWSGDAPLVTVIKPTPGRAEAATYTDLSSGPVAGFIREEGTGKATYLTARTPTRLQAGGLVTRAEALMVVEDAGSETMRGLILGCQSVTASADTVLLPNAGEIADFVFEWSGGDFRIVEPLVVPQSFSWEQTPDGVVPLYD